MEKVLLPKLGESIVSATVVHWLKNEGDFVEKDEPLLEVMTDKVNSEIPAPCSGILQEIRAAVDQEVEVGELLCVIVAELESSGFLSPAVQTLVKESRLTTSEVKSIPGSGEGGRVCKKDVENYIQERPTVLSPLRKAIAKELTASQNVPTATLIDEVSVTELMKWIGKEKESFLREHQAKLTITSCIAKASGRALAKLPLLNATLDGDKIVLHKDAHIGMAVSVEGGVLVPVISSCQTKSLAEIAKEISKASKEIREGRWKKEGDHVATFTMTNFGMGKVPIGIPMIVPGQAAILGIGALQKKVLVDEDDRFFVGQTVFLSLTFDHRLVDGMYASQFFQVLRESLYEFRIY